MIASAYVTDGDITVNHLHSADCVLVLDSGRIKYQGTLPDIQALGFNLTGLEADVTFEEKIAPAALAQAEEEDSIEQAEDEAPLAKASTGLTPYLFFMRMATWEHASVAIVSLLPVGIELFH
jgi:hypothetical protein